MALKTVDAAHLCTSSCACCSSHVLGISSARIKKREGCAAALDTRENKDEENGNINERLYRDLSIRIICKKNIESPLYYQRTPWLNDFIWLRSSFTFFFLVSYS